MGRTSGAIQFSGTLYVDNRTPSSVQWLPLGWDGLGVGIAPAPSSTS